MTLNSAEIRPEPLMLARIGSFHVGGQEVVRHGEPVQTHCYAPGGVPARFDPNGRYAIEQLYCQFFLPATPCSDFPLLMWHGGGMSGVTYETTPDGREGWLTLFLRWGWPVYVSDAVERGRAGWAALPKAPWAGDPVLMPLEHAVERFRLAPVHGEAEATQFPMGSLSAFGRQLVPRWTSTDQAALDAYLALLARTGPAVILAHSQGGTFAMQAASKRPDLVKALVLIEPANPQAHDVVPKNLAQLPILAVYGDGIAADDRWPELRQRAVDLGQAVQREGGEFEMLDLPSLGILGNTHLLMMDQNNSEIAGLIHGWLKKKGLCQ